MLSLRALLAAIPIAALSVAVPLVNHVEPRIAGFPFVLFWIVAWIFLAPLFLLAIARVERRW